MAPLGRAVLYAGVQPEDGSGRIPDSRDPGRADRLTLQGKKFAASEGRPGLDRTVLFGKHHGQVSLGQLELGLDLAALDGIAGALEPGPQFSLSSRKTGPQGGKR
ncbi:MULTISPECIES: hypothetical protein [Sinorhizobium]|uniref:Uncharacterized protein n=1 Tax=Sinorhizobium americanum TaxID=194963 RepID=A0A2S3YQP7_9HYPH|nr:MULTISPECIES: hypothetical protein [Sinorhizobium]PDT34933.1 hypothetical protein CO656_26845 [Sinorhizobium sp. FG01]POH33613.1 hypothetical protein ATY31_10220 [Sinorhizobium americanum]